MATPEVEVKNTVVDNVGLVYPTHPTAALSFAERHRTIGQVETVLLVKVVLSKNDGIVPSVAYDKIKYGPTLLKRVVPEGRTSACRFTSPGMSSAMARMLALAVETVKGYDSTSARLAANIFVASYPEIVASGHPLDAIFKGERAATFLELTFDSGKSTNPNLNQESKFTVYAALADLVASAERINTMLGYTDKYSDLPEVKTAVKATKAAKTVEIDLW